jgi:hypothetical protein
MDASALLLVLLIRRANPDQKEIVTNEDLTSLQLYHPFQRTTQLIYTSNPPARGFDVRSLKAYYCAGNHAAEMGSAQSGEIWGNLGKAP